MRVKVISEFRDKELDLKLRKVGEELEVNEKRAEKLIAMGLVEKIKKKATDM